MCTSGLVGVVNRDGTIDYVYNHFDSKVPAVDLTHSLGYNIPIE